MNDDITDLTKQIIAFRDARDWKQFHHPKDLALSLVLEAGEVMEHFQWKDAEEVERHIREHKEDIADELADVFNYILIMSHDFKIDIAEAAKRKIAKNEAKYPIEKAKGRHTKYDRL